MHIVAISDLHGYLPATVPQCDLLAIAGDVCPDFQGSGSRSAARALHVSERQADWLRRAFSPWISRQPAAAVVMCWGNHDYVGEEASAALEDLPVALLTDSSCLVQGLTIYGMPWTTFAPEMWAFDVAADDIVARTDAIPSDVDILLTHGPAFGVLDTTVTGERAGSHALLEAIARIKPRLHLFGHIHEARGAQGFSYNLSLLDVRYRPYPLPLTEIDV
jgi:Icc-related predicted phosphoesterase